MKHRPYLIYLMLSWLILAAFSLVGMSSNEQDHPNSNEPPSISSQANILP